jgi:hypothetical protein
LKPKIIITKELAYYCKILILKSREKSFSNDGMTRSYTMSEADRLARAERMRRVNVDPKFRAKLEAVKGRQIQSPDR